MTIGGGIGGWSNGVRQRNKMNIYGKEIVCKMSREMTNSSTVVDNIRLNIGM